MGFSKITLMAIVGLASTLVVPGPASGLQANSNEVAGLSVDTRVVELDESLSTSGAGVDGAQGALRIGEPGATEDPSGASMLVIHDTTGDLELSIRSLNHGEWSEWVEVSSGEDEAPDGLAGSEGATSPAVAIGPIWVGDASEVEIVKTGGAAASITVDFLTDANPEGPSASAALAGPSQPSIQPRSAWAGDDHPWASENGTCDGGPFYADNIQAAIVHHTVTSNGYSQAQAASIIRGIYYSHVRVNGWCDVAYQFLVDKYGTIWQGRSGDISRPVIGGHARGFNTSTVGVALLGQYQAGASPASARPTGAQIGALEALISWKLGLHGVDPLGTTWLKNRATSGIMRFASHQWVQLPTVVGHRDVGLTSCPGSFAYPSVVALRSRIAQGRVGPGPYNFPRWQPSSHGPAMLTVESTGGIRPAFAADVVSDAPGSLGARSALAIGGNRTAGYLLLSDGTLAPYGSAPSVSGAPAGAATDDLVVRSDGASGWILSGDRLVGFGGASPIGLATPAVAADLDDDGRGYAVGVNGGLISVGGAPGRDGPTALAAPVADVGVRPDRSSGWVLDTSGNLHGFGGAPSTSVPVAAGTARGLVASPTGLGGWVMNADGELLPFGDERPAIPISTHVGVANAAGVALVDYVTGDDVRATDDGAYIDALAKAFLGRPASDVELDVWVSQLDFKSNRWLADRLSTSEEYAGAVIDQIYLNALGREPDSEGRAYWLGQIRDGMAPQELGIYFYGSDEFFARSGGAEGFVDEMYRVLLFREPDESGRRYWLERLRRGQATSRDVAADFYASIESRRDRVSKLYRRFLGRSPDTGGLDYWADRLHREGDFVLAAEFAVTHEFYTLAQTN